LKVKFEIILTWATLVCVAVCVGVGLVGGKRERSHSVCRGMKVTVLDSTEKRNLESKKLVKLVRRDFGAYVNRPLDSVNLHRVERILSGQKCLESCQAYLTSDGILNIEVTQCTPVLKIHRQDSTVAYLNRKGEMFEVDSDWCSCIPEIKANDLLKNPLWASRVANLAEYIGRTPSLKNKIREIACKQNGDITMTVEGRPEAFDFGQPTEIIDKFSRINTYLEKIAGTKEYKTVSLKNKGQIVCK